jgi:4'-phosphopantetheinyl transferase
MRFVELKHFMKSFTQSIHLWSLYLPELRDRTESCRGILSADEAARAEQFRRPADADGFVLGRGLLRQVLAECLQRDPARLSFVRNAQGKPFLAGGELEFNVSHSRDRLLIAVTAGRRVGVDIEFRRDGLSMEAIAQRWFSAGEQAFFRCSENPAAAFFDIWAKKEAYVKARGSGIFQELNAFTVPCGGAADPSIRTSEDNWFFQSLEIDPAYAAAVVLEGGSVVIRQRQLIEKTL